jgi:hypothetical protein
MGNFTKNRILESGSTSVVVPGGSAAERPLAPVFGQFRFNTDIAKLEFFNGTSFIPITTANDVTYTIDSFTGDGSTTVFTMSIQESAASAILVFVGSIYQDSTSAYTVDGGYDITFTSAPPDGDPISVIHSRLIDV